MNAEASVASASGFVRGSARVLLQSLLGAALGLVVAALCEAYWVADRQGESWMRAALVSAGLLGPFGLATGVVACAAGLFLHGVERGAVPFGRAGTFERSDARPQLFALWCLTPPVLALWFVAVVGVSFGSFTEGDGAPRGALVGLYVGLSLFFALVVAAGGVWLLAERLRERAPAPALGAAFGLLGASAFLGAGVVVGEPGGEGNALLLLGVFRRAELDLRPVFLLGLLLGCAYLLPLIFRRIPTFASALLVVVFYGVTTAHVAGSDFEMTAIERAAPLGRLGLGMLRRATDRDRDGFSALYGDGDCSPSDPTIYPGASDVPGNGKDEDCSGADDAVLALPSGGASSAPKAREPVKVTKDLNLLLISVDTLRADLGFAGYPRKVSPNLDALAARATLFENAYALASYTPKSVGPLLIGKYSGETHRDFTHFNSFGKDDTFLQERVKKAGIRTVSVQSFWYLFTPGSGYVRGFDAVDSSAAPKTPQGEGDRSVTGDKVTDRAISQLGDATNTGGRFFFWVHYVDPHTEYVVHDGLDFGKGPRDRYDSEVAFVDREVGRLLAHLEKSPWASKTAVIVTSDHGEAFGEHGMIRHGFELWEELVRVPLLVYVPGAQPRRIAARRSAIDIAPTVLELLGLPQPSGAGTDFMSGESLLPDVFLEGNAAPSERPVFVDMSAGPHNEERQAYLDGDHKLVVSNGRALSLFDLESDPAETKNLVRDKALLAPVFERYKAFKQRLRPVYVRRP